MLLSSSLLLLSVTPSWSKKDAGIASLSSLSVSSSSIIVSDLLSTLAYRAKLCVCGTGGDTVVCVGKCATLLEEEGVGRGDGELMLVIVVLVGVIGEGALLTLLLF